MFFHETETQEERGNQRRFQSRKELRKEHVKVRMFFYETEVMAGVEEQRHQAGKGRAKE